MEKRNEKLTQVILTNDFHGIRVSLVARDGYLTRRQVSKARRALCPSPDCTCGNTFGARGRQEIDLEPLEDGGARVISL